MIKAISFFLRRPTAYFSPGIIFAVYMMFMGLIQEAAAQDSQPLPPPVEIEFTLGNTSGIGEDILLKLKVTPQEDMHADIRCLLPEGVEPIEMQGIMLLPSDERYFLNTPLDTLYYQAIGLYVGPLKGGMNKEFNFRIKITDNKQHELIALVEALAKWGIKEQRLTVGK